MIISRVCVVIGIAISILASPAWAQTHLRLIFKEGDKAKYLVEYRISAQNNVIKLSSTRTFHVAKLEENGEAQVKVSTLGPTFSVVGPDGKEQVPQFFNWFQGFAHKELTLTTDGTGKIMAIKVPEPPKNNLVKNQGFDGKQTYDAFPEKLTLGQLTLPEDAVREGASWTQKYLTNTTEGECKTQVILTYEGKLKKDGKSLQKIGLESRVFQPKGPPKGSKGTGEIYLDTDTEQIVEINWNTVQAISPGVSEEKVEINLTMKRIK